MEVGFSGEEYDDMFPRLMGEGWFNVEATGAYRRVEE